VHQFVQCIKQLNAYTMQLPYWNYSPSYNLGMKPANVPFTGDDLAGHNLQMCPHAWQDQYNLHKKGMILMDILLRQQSAYVHRKKPTHNLARRLPLRARQEPSTLVLGLRPGFSRRSVSRSIANYARSMEACIPHTVPRTVASMQKMDW
jgi:hypothetical protein